MIVNPGAVLRDALAQQYAVGAFNTYNLEITTGIIRAAERSRAPVIIQVGSSALIQIGKSAFLEFMLAYARHAEVPVVVHLDHAIRIDDIQSAIRVGCNSVMFDGSKLPYERNVHRTAEAVELAHRGRVWIEGELGGIGGEEDQGMGSDSVEALTDPLQVEDFVDRTDVDALAIAIGNQHGFYSGEPKLDFDRLDQIRDATFVPLVLHGASGLPEKSISEAIRAGICKINVNTDLRRVYFGALREKLRHSDLGNNLINIMIPVIKAVEEEVVRKIQLFGSAGKADTTVV